MTRGATLHLLVVAALFSSAFIAIEKALEGLTPVGLAWTRMAVGAAVLLLLFGGRPALNAWRRVSLPAVAALGLLTFAAPYTLLAVAEQSLDAATVGVCFGAGPAITMIMSAWLEGEVVRPQTLLAVLLGAAGATLAAWSSAGPRALGAPATVWVLLTLVCYALSGILTRRWARTPADVPGLLTAALVVAAVLGAPLLFVVPVARPAVSPSALLAVVYLGAVPTALGFFARFLLTVRTSVTWTSTAGWLVPLFATLWSTVLDEQTIAPLSAAGLVLIALGVVVLRPATVPGAPAHPPAPAAAAGR